MDLWIRSQDEKVILKPAAISLDNLRTSIFGYYGDDYYKVLGKYKTEERALEVLDEIQDILRGKYAVFLDFKDAFSSNFTVKQAQKLLEQMAVYDMPKE